MPADCPGMHHGASFAEVLDATLRGFQPQTATRHAAPPVRPVPPNPFLFTVAAPIGACASRPLGVPSAARIEISSGTAAPVSTRVQASAPPPREERPRPAAAPVVDGRPAARPVVATAPRRTLTSGQQRSLAAFIAAGA